MIPAFTKSTRPKPNQLALFMGPLQFQMSGNSNKALAAVSLLGHRMLAIHMRRQHHCNTFEDTLTSSAETEYAIVCPSAMRVIRAVLNVVCASPGARAVEGGSEPCPEGGSLCADSAGLRQSEPDKP